MVNMNKYKNPAVYALKHDGRIFYVGYTSTNALNRYWQHVSRASSGHTAPVYERMREVGIRDVEYDILEEIGDPGEAANIEARWIKELLASGEPLTNVLGIDGVPNSIPKQMRDGMARGRIGKPTWIKGLTGEDAGWTDVRRSEQADTIKRNRAMREISSPGKLFLRMDQEEMTLIRSIQKELLLERAPTSPESPRSGVAHGTRTMYETYACRCAPCRDAMARQNAKRRGKDNWESVVAKPLDVIPAYKVHGTAASYTHGGCRCADCKLALMESRALVG